MCVVRTGTRRGGRVGRYRRRRRRPGRAGGPRRAGVVVRPAPEPDMERREARRATAATRPGGLVPVTVASSFRIRGDGEMRCLACGTTYRPARGMGWEHTCFAPPGAEAETDLMRVAFDLLDEYEAARRLVESEVGDPTGHSPEITADVAAWIRRIEAAAQGDEAARDAARDLAVYAMSLTDWRTPSWQVNPDDPA